MKYEGFKGSGVLRLKWRSFTIKIQGGPRLPSHSPSFIPRTDPPTGPIPIQPTLSAWKNRREADLPHSPVIIGLEGGGEEGFALIQLLEEFPDLCVVYRKAEGTLDWLCSSKKEPHASA